VHRLVRSFVVLLAILAIPWSAAWASQTDHPACPIGQSPAFVFGFASLHEQLGTAMGDPIECEHADVETGDTYQRTTTGLALYRRDTNTSMFTNGREHWALTASGLAYWSGWHGSAAPAGVATASQDVAEPLTAPSGPYHRVEAVTIVEVLDQHGQRLVIQREATTFLIETDGGCVPHRPQVGEVVFVVALDEPAGLDSRVMLAPGGRECRITDSRPL
jgi:hypothetical protein